MSTTRKLIVASAGLMIGGGISLTLAQELQSVFLGAQAAVMIGVASSFAIAAGIMKADAQ